MNLKKLFIDHCEDQQYEINQNQLDIINYLKIYFTENRTSFYLIVPYFLWSSYALMLNTSIFLLN